MTFEIKTTLIKEMGCFFSAFETPSEEETNDYLENQSGGSMWTEDIGMMFVIPTLFKDLNKKTKNE